MASIGMLVKAVAEAANMEEGSVKVVARYAREAGFIGQGTTGGGAARMTERDAANLLIALAGSDLAKNSAQAIEVFRSAKTSGKPRKRRSVPRVPDFVIHSLSSGLTFGEGLERLIAGFRPGEDGKSECDLYAEKRPRMNNHLQGWRLRVTFYRPVMRASILFSVSDRLEGKTFYHDPWKHSDDDWQIETSFGFETLNAVGRVLAT